MPCVISKRKEYRSMTQQPSQRGRVFCVTGVQGGGVSVGRNIPVSPITRHPSGPSFNKASITGQSDTDSNTSGYLSSSSFESSGEEKRLNLNENKVFRLWDKLSERVQAPSGPKSSTPKEGSERLLLKKRTNISSDSGKSMLAIKKNLNERSKTATVSSVDINNKCEDSFWGIKTPRVQKSSSEGDIRNTHKTVLDNAWKRNPINFNGTHDAGLNIDISSSRNQEWKRKPFLTQSTSEYDLRATSNTSDISQRHSGDYSHHSALPRYRVKVYDPREEQTNLVSQICRSCADFADQGKPVDESMSEFLSNVDEDNLASFLNFYDKVTSSSAYERARKNTNNYEAVYY